MRAVLPLVAAWTALGCGGRIDAATDAGAPADGGGGEPWACGDLDGAPDVVLCTAGAKAACQAWAQSLVHEGVAHSVCVDDDAAAWPPVGCVPASECHQIAQDIFTCTCGDQGGACILGRQVCVSDGLAPLGRCVPACSQ